MQEESQGMSRRHFVAGVGAALAAPAVWGTASALGAEAAAKVTVGVIGCGGRGRFIAGLMQQHGGYTIAAAADYFQDRVDSLGQERGVPAERRFTTLSGYKRLLELKDIDAIVVTSPPGFHPEQCAAAVAAGKHVYVAKPIAVDVPGCQTIEAAAKQATAGKRCFLVDFQTRADPHYVEAVQRVHAGAIGDFVFGESSYHCGRLGIHAPPGTPEARLRNWVFDRALSGDIITEQNVHTLDVMSWIMNAPPLHATGTGGRKVRVDVGDCWDYFTLVYEYANQVGIAFSSRQFDAQGTKPDGILNRMFGTKGVLETSYGGPVLLRAAEVYKGSSPQIYVEGATANVAAFHRSILAGDFGNPTVANSVRSTLVTILGRTAAYQQRRVAWAEIVGSTERLDLKLAGLQA